MVFTFWWGMSALIALLGVQILFPLLIIIIGFIVLLAWFAIGFTNAGAGVGQVAMPSQVEASVPSFLVGALSTNASSVEGKQDLINGWTYEIIKSRNNKLAFVLAKDKRQLLVSCAVKKQSKKKIDVETMTTCTARIK